MDDFRQHARRRAVALALSALVAALGIAGTVPRGAALVVACAFAALAAGFWTADAAGRTRRRRSADRLLAALDTPRVPDRLAWRARELTSPRERRILARTLVGIVRALDEPPQLHPVPVNRRAVARNRRELAALATRLAAVERPVSPHGVAIVHELVTDGQTSPLYDTGDAGDDLREVLEAARSAIEPR